MCKDYGLVSVIMPAFNSEAYIRQAIDSVLMQTYQNLELLVVDDCSSDGTVGIVEEYQKKDNRVRLFLNSSNSGAAKTRNVAIEKAAGRWIAFLDSDDFWAADKLCNHLTFMVESAVYFSFTPYQTVDLDGNKISSFYPSKKEYTYGDILKSNSIGCSTAIYDSRRFGKVFMLENAVKREDMACWLAILKKGEKGVLFNECLTFYREGGQSVSSSKIRMIKYQWLVYRKVENLSLIKSFYLMCHWAINGLKKHKNKSK